MNPLIDERSSTEKFMLDSKKRHPKTFAAGAYQGAGDRPNPEAYKLRPTCVDCGTSSNLVKIVRVVRPSDGSLIPHVRRKGLCARCAVRFDTGSDKDERNCIRYIRKAQTWAQRSDPRGSQAQRLA